MIFEIVFFFFLVYFFTRSKDRMKSKYTFKLWLIVFVVYSFYMMIACSYIDNPERNFFVSNDQISFYVNAKYLGNKSYTAIFAESFSEYNLLIGQHPLATWLFAVLYKLSIVFEANNSFMFLLFFVAFADSLIPIVIFKIIDCRTTYKPEQIFKATLLFAFISPFFFYSTQLLRDVFIALFYTIMIYLALNKDIRMRYVLIVLLGVITYFFRYENGLFSLVFLLLAFFERFLHSHFVVKVFVGILAVGLMITTYSIIEESFQDTNDKYVEITSESGQSKEMKSVSKMPFPLNYVVPVVDKVLAPTPFWIPFVTWKGNSWNWLQFSLCLFPFYFLPRLLFILFSTFKDIKGINREIIVLILIAALYLLVNASNPTTRRMMAVYPAIFAVYMIVKEHSSVKMRRMVNYSVFIFCGLYMLYFIVKL